MADLTPQERLQPSLLDRLTDTDRSNTAEPRERRVLSVQRLKAGVLRDLGWLLNTGHFETLHDLEPYPQVRNSVLNFGIPDLSGHTVADLEPEQIEKIVRDAIVTFEPRINAHTLRVTVELADRMSRNAVTFKIEGELWSHPAPMALFLKTELDLESGDVNVTDS
jgi:type VI secretion system protein ImpF